MNGTCRVTEELLSLPIDSVAEMYSINRLIVEGINTILFHLLHWQ